MAYTRIHAIKTTVDRSIAYICNPDKTDGELFISSFGCSPKTAPIEFAYANGKISKKGENLAHHLIQSFTPGEVSFEEAHRIGTELADKLLEGKYSYVIATHIEKDHVHNHIIFCATDNIEHRKYNTCKKNYYRIRKLSDELCREHNLSVITPGQQRGKKRQEWEAEKEGKSWKDKIRRDIDAIIKLSNSYEDFIRMIKRKGYEIKGENFDGTLKYISFRLPGKERFVRGSSKSLGTAYTRETIRERIESRDRKHNEYKQPDYSKKKLIDTSQGKFKESPGLKHWADIENLKIAASTYANANSITELEQKIKEKKSLAKDARSELVDLEHDMKSTAEILKYAEQYAANKPFHLRSKKSKNPDAYFRSHESQLLLYDGAKNMLRRAGMDLKNINPEQMRVDYHAMEKKKAELQRAYRSAEKEAGEMELKRNNLNQYLGRETEPEH
jgi:hypothetical protein